MEFPTPEKLAGAGAHRWKKFLHVHRLWRPGTVEKRLEIFGRAAVFQGSAPVVKAKSQLAVSLCKVLGPRERESALL